MAFEQGWLKRRNAARAKQQKDLTRFPIRAALQELYAAQRAGFATAAEYQAFKDAELAKLDVAVSSSDTQTVNQVIEPTLSVTDAVPATEAEDLEPEIERIGKLNGISESEIKAAIEMQKSQKTLRGRPKKV